MVSTWYECLLKVTFSVITTSLKQVERKLNQIKIHKNRFRNNKLMATSNPPSPIKTFREHRHITEFGTGSVFHIIHKSCLFYSTLSISLSSNFWSWILVKANKQAFSVIHTVIPFIKGLIKKALVFQNYLTINLRIVTNDELRTLKKPIFKISLKLG